MTTPANFNGAAPKIDPNNAVMLLIDHQSGLFNTVRDLNVRNYAQMPSPLPKLLL